MDDASHDSTGHIHRNGHHDSPAHSEHLALLKALHAQRDALELERARHFGALVAHDFNNALFALVGRLQVLKMKVTQPDHTKAVDQLLETTRLIESQISNLHAACPRPASISTTTAPARPLLERELTRIGELLPCVMLDVAAALEAIPADVTIALDSAVLAVALTQLLSLHRQRGAEQVRVSSSIDSSASKPTLTLSICDEAGTWEHALTAPSLLNGTFAIPALPLGTAQRALRDVGGAVELRRTANGLASVLTLPMRRGIALAQQGAHEHDHAHDHDHDDACDHSTMVAPESRKILIADDDVAVRAVLVAALEAVNDDVDTTDDPSSIERRSDLAEFDAIILDAGGGGIEALRAIRARGNEVPVLLSSGDVISGDFGPRTRVVQKPISLAVLDRELTKLATIKRSAH